jgi:peptidoglycan/LPS O-acetylase OafA/YrhL
MEGLRGFAVFLVFLVHYVVLSSPWIDQSSLTYRVATALEYVGNTGVDLFFVLSGFLIYGSLIKRPRSFSSYISRRIERIYPTFLAVLLLYIGLSFLFPSKSKIPSEPAEAITYLLQNFLLLPGIFRIEPIISVTWSLSFEVLFYISIPIIIAVLALRSWRSEYRSVLFLVLAILILIYPFNFGIYNRMAMFLSGILLYEVLANYTPRFKANGIGLLALFSGFFLILLMRQVNSEYGLQVAVIFIAFFFLCFDSFNNPKGFAASVFSWKPLRLFGNMSYSYFLIHGLTINIIFSLVSIVYPSKGMETITFWLVLPLIFLTTLIPAIVVFILIERPYSLMPPHYRKMTQDSSVSDASKELL